MQRLRRKFSRSKPPADVKSAAKQKEKKPPERIAPAAPKPQPVQPIEARKKEIRPPDKKPPARPTEAPLTRFQRLRRKFSRSKPPDTIKPEAKQKEKKSPDQIAPAASPERQKKPPEVAVPAAKPSDKEPGSQAPPVVSAGDKKAPPVTSVTVSRMPPPARSTEVKTKRGWRVRLTVGGSKDAPALDPSTPIASSREITPATNVINVEVQVNTSPEETRGKALEALRDGSATPAGRTPRLALNLFDDLAPQPPGSSATPKTWKILVTGGGGFLGRAIVERLRRRGVKVRSFSRGAYPELFKLGAETISGDLANADAVKRACEGCDMVFHVAAMAGVWGPFEEYHRVNVEGTKNVIDACKAAGVQRLIFTSSPSVVFDGRDMENVNESVPYAKHFHAAYPQTKAMAERLVLAANCKELATIALRPHLIWGPGDAHLVPRILCGAQSLRRIAGINKKVDCVYIDNAAEAHLLAAGRLRPDTPIAGKSYFISNGEPRPLWDLVNGILAAADLPPVTKNASRTLTMAAARSAEAFFGLFGIESEPRLTRFVVEELTTAHWFDIRAAQMELNYQPAVSIDEGLARLRTWLHGAGAAWFKSLRIAPQTQAPKSQSRSSRKPAHAPSR